MSKVQVFHIGPQKAATTWLYHCFEDHPEISVANTDAVHYFDMLFTRGENWYHQHFEAANEAQVLMDMTPSYIRSSLAAERIRTYNPEAKIILCLRDPIERAFSHYWHAKKKGRYDYTFSECLKSYNLYSNWIETGFYALHIERYLQHFSREQILAQQYEDIAESPDRFLKAAYKFIGVSADHTPDVINEKINAARPQRSGIEKTINQTAKKLGVHGPVKKALKAGRSSGIIKEGHMETLEDVPPNIIEMLLEIYEPHTAQLEALLDIDLSAWRSKYKQ